MAIKRSDKSVRNVLAEFDIPAHHDQRGFGPVLQRLDDHIATLSAEINGVVTQDDTETCLDCGEEYLMTTQHVEWFLARGMTAPKRCTVCRAERKNYRTERRAPNPVIPVEIARELVNEETRKTIFAKSDETPTETPTYTLDFDDLFETTGLAELVSTASITTDDAEKWLAQIAAFRDALWTFCVSLDDILDKPESEGTFDE